MENTKRVLLPEFERTVMNNHSSQNETEAAKRKKEHKGLIIAGSVIGVIAIVALVVILNFESILNFALEKTMGKESPQLQGEPEIGISYAIDIDEVKSSDGSRWQGYIRKGIENKVIIYFYGGGYSTNSYMAARPLDGNETGFYNSKLNTSLNVMTSAIVN